MKKPGNILLFGYKSVGKSSFGRKLAAHLGLVFIDTDNLIEERYELLFKEPLNCRQIFLKKGEAFFRSLESTIIQCLEETKHSIIALGGGTIIPQENYHRLRALGPLIYLNLDKEILKKRTLKAPLPAYIDPLDPESAFDRIYEARLPLYKARASHTIDMASSFEEVIASIQHLTQTYTPTDSIS